MRITTLWQFSVPDLSAIARSLDELEQSYTDGRQGRSGNMDDTGAHPTAWHDQRNLQVTRLFLAAGTTESPGIFESFVGVYQISLLGG